ncbi:hypothetical protein, partial [Corallococcus exiguus]|uniref:hypothetical protein n=1 Tax=Corallococcus exiguus TaxID=83462 RepID=UPI001B8BCFE8
VDIAPDADASLRDLSDYSACQVFADLARAAEAEGVRSASVRCPSRGVTYSWLTCRVFVKPAPVRRQTWRMRVTPTSVQALCESPRLALEFQRSLFESDPRVAPRAVGAST